MVIMGGGAVGELSSGVKEKKKKKRSAMMISALSCALSVYG